MVDRQISAVRVEQSQSELERLDEAVRLWVADRHAKDLDPKGDYAGRHETQLRALESVLEKSVASLRDGLGKLSLDLDVGQVYQQCRKYDGATVGARRVWEYYKEKLDQRDDPELCGVLRAADELVWSCYRQVFSNPQKLDPRFTQGPTPLPYVEWTNGVYMLEQDAALKQGVPADIRGLEDFLNTLPISILRLPLWCIDSPWWLVFIAHEIGHHVQTQLRLQVKFALGIRAAAESVAADAHARFLPEPDPAYWQRCSAEIFADVFSVLMMGPWAVWALAEVVWTAPEKMTQHPGETRASTYPSPVVRLALMAAVAKKLGMDASSALRGIKPEEIAALDKLARADLRVVEPVVAFALAPLEGELGVVGKLQDLCAVEPGAYEPIFGSVATWGQTLLSGNTSVLNPPPLETARRVVCGALSAWADLAGVQDASQRQGARPTLVRATVDTLVKNAPAGTRAAVSPSGDMPEKGQELADLLLAAAAEE